MNIKALHHLVPGLRGEFVLMLHQLQISRHAINGLPDCNRDRA